MKKHNIFKALLTSLLALVLVAGTFATGVKATTYDPAADSVSVDANSVYAILKADGADLGPNNFKSLTGTTIDLSKLAVNKDLCFKILADTDKPSEKTFYDPDFTVKATPYKKLVVSINYAAGADALAITKITLTATDKSVEEVTAADTAEAKVALWGRLYYSLDNGATWVKATAGDGAFKGAKLAELTAKTSATKVLFKLMGVADPAERGTKPVAVSIKNQKKLKSVKVDYVKGTIAIKNGMDYAVKTDGEPTESDWKSVLPYNKNGAVTAYADAIGKASTTIVPVKYNAKVTGSDTFYTTVKVKTLDLGSLIGENDEVTIYVRTSATAAAPASQSVNVTVSKAAEAPAFTGTGNYKKDEIKSTFDSSLEYLIVPTADLSKIDTAASKWSKLANGAVLKLDKAQSNLVYENGSKSKCKLEKSATMNEKFLILVRVPAVKGKSLASAYAQTVVTYTAEVTGESPVDGLITWTVKQ